ncbi:MAG: hypothetical protein K6E36_11085 [Oscillospiraceae bacterium]|nr:hypothetical protein [Oscillospiraceae bacterium]
MQARLRRNRIVMLGAMLFGIASTSGIQSIPAAMQRSWAADTTFAAATVIRANEMNAQVISGAELPDGDLAETETADANAYEATDWWKADLYEYDDSFSLTSYEAAAQEPETITTTTASTTDATEETVTTTITTFEEPAITAKHTITAEPNSVVFYTSGFGHGVGMSQNGANFYAKYDGLTYDQILQLYFPGTRLVQTGTPESETMTIRGKTDTVVNTLAQIVNNEMGPTFSTEALKAQAVAAYTFYLYNGHGAGMICKSKPAKKIVDAVRSVLGVVVYYNNKPALTMFSASSAGCTASCKDIFYQDLPYLRSHPVKHDESSDPHFNSTKVYSVTQLKARLEKVYKVKLTGTPYDWMKLEYGDGGYVSYVTIGGKVRVKGNDFRYAMGLKSPKFEFVYQQGEKAPKTAVVTTEPAVYSDPGATHASIAVKYTTTTTTTTTAATTKTASASSETSGTP